MGTPKCCRKWLLSKREVFRLPVSSLAIEETLYAISSSKRWEMQECWHLTKNTNRSRKSSLPNYKVISVHFMVWFPPPSLYHICFQTQFWSPVGMALVKSQGFWLKELQKKKKALLPFCLEEKAQPCNNTFICFENEKGVREKVNSEISSVCLVRLWFLSSDVAVGGRQECLISRNHY